MRKLISVLGALLIILTSVWISKFKIFPSSVCSIHPDKKMRATHYTCKFFAEELRFNLRKGTFLDGDFRYDRNKLEE